MVSSLFPCLTSSMLSSCYPSLWMPLCLHSNFSKKSSQKITRIGETWGETEGNPSISTTQLRWLTLMSDGWSTTSKDHQKWSALFTDYIRLPGLVNIQKANWKITMFDRCTIGKSTISMTIFNGYVKLPEGINWVWLPNQYLNHLNLWVIADFRM